MRETIEIGSSPYGEQCAQVGEDNYNEKARRECRAYIGQLRRVATQWMRDHGFTALDKPEGFDLVIKSNAHDFGSYFEVVCKFNDGDATSCDLAYYLEGNSPEFWDDEAKRELSGMSQSDIAAHMSKL